MSQDDPTLPRRLTTAQVCALAGYGPKTLRRRLKAGALKIEPVDRGRENLFDRDSVLKALGMTDDAPISSPWDFDPDAFRQARARKVRHGSPPSGRDIPRAVRGSATPAPLRLVPRDSAPADR